MSHHVRQLALCTAAIAGACSSRVQPTPVHPAPAVAVVRDAAGTTLGALRLERTGSGARITGLLTGLPEGKHGLHFHEAGQCDAPGFTTAGAHFNPAAKHHGLENPEGPHAGDLPNIVVAPTGRVQVDLTTTRVTLDSAASTGLFDADGSALVVHAAADDQRTDPSGNSGARIACGAVVRTQ